MLVLLSTSAFADTPAADTRPTSTANLDGTYLVLGPIGGATHARGEWDGGFGGEISLVRIRERQALAALGASIGALRFTSVEKGRIFAEISLASRRPLGLALGVNLGVTAELDQVVPPRFGGQASLWVFAGVIPYIRVGAVQKSGMFVDLGLKIALPTLKL